MRFIVGWLIAFGCIAPLLVIGAAEAIMESDEPVMKRVLLFGAVVSGILTFALWRLFRAPFTVQDHRGDGKMGV